MTSRPLVILGLFIILIAVVSAGGYIYHVGGSPFTTQIPMASSTEPIASTSPDFYATSTPPGTIHAPATTTSAKGTIASSTLANIPLPTTVKVDTSNWPIHLDKVAGYSIEYPANMIESSLGSVFGLAFPKNVYFRWPLQDDAKVSVSASPKCPALTVSAQRYPFSEFDLNNLRWKRTIAAEGAAGTVYVEVAYETLHDGRCYQISYLSRGATSAGLYVDNATLAKKYDIQHDADFAAVMDILNGMVASLRLLATP